MISLICRIKKTKQTGKYNKKETDSQIQKTNLWLSKGRGKGGETNWGMGLTNTNYYI